MPTLAGRLYGYKRANGVEIEPLMTSRRARRSTLAPEIAIQAVTLHNSNCGLSDGKQFSVQFEGAD